MEKDSFIDKIIKWLESKEAAPEQTMPPKPIVKEVIKNNNYEEELKNFPDLNEKEFFVEVQDIIWQQIRSLSNTKSIRFYSIEVGVIIECPLCYNPSEIKVEARDTWGNRFFLIKCLSEDTLWVDEEFINGALEKRMLDLISIRKDTEI